MQTSSLSAIDQALQIAKTRSGPRPPIVAIAGAQGSGKSWLARAFAQTIPGAVHLSLDDFYLSSTARRTLSETVHPLFATRGVPGTHDLVQMNETLAALRAASAASRTPLPAFDKQQDEAHPKNAWRTFEGRPSVIIFEGWCLGALPQSAQVLAIPINALERDEDADAIWRSAVNQRLATDYAAMFARLDAIVFLKAPSFDVVHSWRCEQEETALGHALDATERAQIYRFVAHFERLTRHMLKGGLRCDLSVALDAKRAALGVFAPPS